MSYICVKEEWRQVVEYEGIYSISNFGRVRRDLIGSRTFVGRIMIGGKNKSGYSQVTLWKNLSKKTIKIHHLVTSAFLGKRPKGKEVNHIDGNKDNNSLSNLEYITKSDNMRHAFNLGLRNLSSGESHGKTTLKLHEVESIRNSYVLKEYSQYKLAKKYWVCQQTICNIVNNKTWKGGFL